MRKTIKIFLSVLSTLVLLAVFVPVVVSIALSSYRVQNYVAGRLTARFSERLGTTVRVGHVGIRLFNRVTLDDVYVEDLRGDTLLYVGRLDAGFRGYDLRTGALRLGEVRVGGASFRVARDSTGVTNLAAVLAPLRRERERPRRRPFVLRATGLVLDSVRFRLQRPSERDRGGAIDFADLDILASADFENIRMVGDSIQLNIKNMEAVEKSGFRLREFSGRNVRVSPTGIRIDQLRIEDDDSRLHLPVLAFDYPRWRAFRDFVRQVDLHAEVEDSELALRTIGRFAPGLREGRSTVRLDGVFDGPVADLAARIDRLETGGTSLRARVRMSGLPAIEHTRFVLEIDELRASAADLDALSTDLAGRPLPPSTVGMLDRLGPLALSGTFDGLLSDFSTDARLTAAAGAADFALRVNPEAGGRTRLDGRVALARFGLGRLLDTPALGEATLTASLDGFLGADSLRITTELAVDSLRYNGYDYRGIRADGQIRNRYFQGEVASDDPNLEFRLDGTFDFNREVPRYDFAMDLRRADLRALGVNRRDSVSVLSARIEARAEGTRLDQITGRGTIRDLTYLFPGDTLRSQEIVLTGDNRSPTKTLTLVSDFADIELRSRMNVTDIVRYARRTLGYYLPSIDSAAVAARPAVDSLPGATAEDSYLLQATVKESGRFAAALLPGLYVEEGTTLSLLLRPATRNFSLILDSELVEYKNLYASGIRLTNRNQADSIALYLSTREAGVGNLLLPGLSVQGGVRDNLVALSAAFENPATRLSAILNTVTRPTRDTLTGARRWHTRFGPSQVNLADERWWVIAPGIVWGEGLLAVDRFRIVNAEAESGTGRQEFLLDGRLSADRADTLHLSMVNFDLAPLSGVVDRYGYRVQGRTGGHADLVAGEGGRLFRADIRFENVRVNDEPIQNSRFVSEWDPAARRIRLSLTGERGDTVLRGGYRPGEGRYRLAVRIPNIDLVHLSPVLSGVMSDLSGAADAALVVTGTDRGPSLDGTIAIRSFGGTVDFTRARYTLSGATVEVRGGDLHLPPTPIYDPEGNRGTLTARLGTGGFRAIDYELRMQTDKLLGLNTTERDNDYFYGKVYASGSVIIRGDRQRVEMDMNLANTPGSTFYMPLSGSSTISEADFIVFRDPSRPTVTGEIPRTRLRQYLREQRRRNPRRSDLNINMQLNVDPGMDVQLVIDPRIGDILRARGSGALTLHVRPREDVFTLSGDYRIDEGSYLFTLMNVLNKRFTIDPGSSIRWTGDPLDALLDVSATYRVRASVAGLTDGAIRQSVPVDCKILLSDRLSRPTINFDIETPTVDTETRSVLQSVMNTQELKSQQFVWLLMSNEFYVDSGLATGGNIGTTTTAVTGIEFLTNQLSNWISTERFLVNVGYTPRNDLTSDEVEGMFSGELIPDRLLVEGEINYNFGNNAADLRTDNPVAGDFALTYIFNNARNLRARVFTRTIDRYDENQGLQEQGAGLYYQKDFNTWRGLFRRARQGRPLLPPPPPQDGDGAADPVAVPTP